MSDSNFVAMESKQCPVCGVIHQYNCGILINKRMRDIKANTPEGLVVTGQGLCEEHYKLWEEGYVAAIEISDNVTEKTNTLKRGEFNPTGNICHIKREKLNAMLSNRHITKEQSMILISSEFFDLLTEIKKRANKGEHNAKLSK